MRAQGHGEGQGKGRSDQGICLVAGRIEVKKQERKLGRVHDQGN
jgi:hypothetical protein